MTVIAPPSGSTSSLAQIALALAEETVRSHHDNAQIEKGITKAESTLRQADLEAGRQELLKSADKALVGGCISAAFQVVAATAQLEQAGCIAAGATAGAKTCEAGATLSQALAKTGDILAASGQYNQAEKLRLDAGAESLKDALQESQRAIASDDDGRRRGLAAMKEIADRAYESARSAIRA